MRDIVGIYQSVSRKHLQRTLMNLFSVQLDKTGQRQALQSVFTKLKENA